MTMTRPSAQVLQRFVQIAQPIHIDRDAGDEYVAIRNLDEE
jgi:hypothetical protein